MKKLRQLSLVFTFLSASISYAENPSWDVKSAATDFDVCYDKTAPLETIETCVYTQNCIDADVKNSTSRGMTKCAKEAFILWDKKLNLEYNLRLRFFGNDENDNRELFIKSQRSWIKFRDAECESRFKRSGYVGSLAGTINQSCLSETTAQRTIQFKLENQRLIEMEYIDKD